MKELRTPIVSSPFTTSSLEPMHTLNVDTIGPFPETEDGYKYIINIIDKFTRYVQLYPSKNVTAIDYANVLIEHFGRWGNAGVIQSDRGSQFVNDVVRELHLILGVHHQVTTAYSKEENAIVERSNKEVNRHLRAFCYEITTHSKWNIYLPFVARIINSEVHESTGVSPNELVMNVRMDSEILIPSEIIETTNLSKWTSEMISIQNKLVNLAIQRQRSRNEGKIARLNDEGKPITEFAVNSFVLCEYPDSRMGSRPPTKLHASLKGPFKVIKVRDGKTYTLLNLVNNKEEIVDIHRLQPFRYDPHIHDPLAIAAKDYQEFGVERIIKHAGDIRRPSSLDFLVRWTGYDESEDLWLPWKELRTNVKLHDYLRDKGLTPLLKRANVI
jgi:hypothetical protein